MLQDDDPLKERWVQMMNPHQLQVAQLPVVRPGLATKIDSSAMRTLKQCIDKLEWPKQGRPTTIGEGKCLGITSLPAGGVCEYAHDGAIVSCRDEHIELTKLINATLLAAYGHKQFCWSSLQINKNTVSTPHRDAANVGLSAITILGDFEGGELYIDDQFLTDSKTARYANGVTMYTGKDEWFTFNGHKTHSSNAARGTRYSIVAFMHGKIDSLSREKKQCLMGLGFNIGPHAFEPTSWNSMRDTTYCRTMPVNVPGQPHKRRLIEIACGHNSTLSRYAYGNEDCDCVRFTAEDDICWKSTHDKIVAAASSDNVLIWISLPCTGGCSYNAKNRRKSFLCDKSVEAHQFNFEHMLKCVLVVLQSLQLRQRYPLIVVELPTGNAYWNFDLLKQFEEGYVLKRYYTHGCAFGLKAIHGPSAGKLMKKPWTLSSNSEVIGNAMSRECCHHASEHCPVEGLNTLVSESYPVQFACEFHKAFKVACESTPMKQ